MSDSEMTDAADLSSSGSETDTEATRPASTDAKKKHLAEMKGALIDERPPYCSGTIAVDPKDLILFFGNGEHVGRIDFSNPSESELEKLMQACDPATFGRGEEHVYDETIRRAGKLDTDKFSAKLDPLNLHVEGSKAINLLDAVKFSLLWGNQIEKKTKSYYSPNIIKDVRAELYKLNIYGKDGFFKSHKDTPRATNMFGSLVIVLPTKHVGGELVFRRDAKEWTFDTASAFSKVSGPAIVYATFFSDVEHEVLPVKEGYRVTLTYNLYYKKPVQERIPRIPTDATIPSNAELFKTALENSLADGDFLRKGGRLGFGLQHLYPVFKKQWACRGNLIKPHLKGFDALVLSACQEVGLKTRVCFLYDDLLLSDNVPAYTVLEGSVFDEIQMNYGGKLTESSKYYEGRVHPVTWVTKHAGLNEHPVEQYGEGTLGNEPNVEHMYAELVLIADVGPTRARKTFTGEEPSSSDKDTVYFAKKEKEEQDSDDLGGNGDSD